MRGLLSAVLCGAALLFSAPSWGQPSSADPVAAAFAEAMANPGDPDAALRYARLLAANGQVRPAIAALERILRLNPRLDNIRLELASLYLAAGSPDIATLYAEQALASPAIPADVAARARQLLASAEKASSPSLVTGSVFFGARYDTNATQATSLSTILLPGAFVPVTPAVTAQGAGSVVGSAQLTHRYDLGLQREGTWESNFSLFDQTFAKISSNFNLLATYADTGPRIGVGDIGPVGWAMRPFLSGTFLAYGADPYALQYGGGLSSYFTLPPRWTLELTGTGRFSNYQNSNFRPLLSGYSGPEWTVLASPTYAFDARTAVTGSVFYYSADARQPYFTRSGPGGTAALATDFSIGNYTVGTAVRAGVRHVSYAAPDPFIDPTQSRRDLIFEAGGSLIFPLTESVAAIAQYGFTQLNSNYAIYSFNDHAVTVGLRLTF
jgi:tetratricopeptide (TPR) repeat protein